MCWGNCWRYKRSEYLPKRPEAGCYETGRCVYNYNCQKLDYQRCKTGLSDGPRRTELLLQVAEEIQTLTLRWPHLVIGHVHRTRVDLNRGEEEGKFGNGTAVKVHQDFFNFFRRVVNSIANPALLLDIHALPHPEQWVELEYKLDSG